MLATTHVISQNIWGYNRLGGAVVGGIPTPLKNMNSSVGMMKFPIYRKIKHVPNHQPDKNGHLLFHHGYTFVPINVPDCTPSTLQ